MSARPIGEIIAPILKDALGIASLQRMLASSDCRVTQKFLIMNWWERGVISDDEAELLIEHNELRAA